MFTKFIGISIILTAAAFAAPFSTKAQESSVDTEYAGIVADLLNPDKLFESLKKNITIPAAPVSEKTGDSITLPTPKEALKDASPKLQEVNKDIKDETGVDFAKFTAWFAKVLKVFFLTVVDLLETVSKALQNDK